VITDVPGFRVGHFSDLEGGTGCTVVLCPPGTIGSGEVRGGAASTAQTEGLRPGGLVEEVHAVLLTGGSAFGLGAIGGVQRFLEERGIGFDTRAALVPIVPTAVLFDLGIGDAHARPSPEDAYGACRSATDGAVPEGTVGAGTGATVAKLPDPTMGVKGGVGSSSAREGDLIVGALAAVNALGAIVDDDGTPIAENRGQSDPTMSVWDSANTTLVAIATNATLSKQGAQRLAAAAHEGVTRAIRPAHTLWDGDTVFALATGPVEAHQVRLTELAAQVTADAIRRGVRAATGLGGVPSVGELRG
jgi:L-aminopeptidase/D-esterase-like protein